MKFKSDIVIGIECHVELNTNTKLFCSCPTHGGEKPNTRTCDTCLGMPGSKPILNKRALEFTLKLGLALNCTIADKLIFSRKSYFYPDLAKNYQITQYELPLGIKGTLIFGDGRAVGITRIHLEEDPAALFHPSGITKSSYVLVDYNRSGNPLVEIVTEPEIYSPKDAREFMWQLISVLEYLEIFDVKNNIIKADANISIKESNYTKVEVKNITGFKEIESALLYEIKRQKLEIEKARRIRQETRSWDTERQITIPLRTKESEEDYGYIIETVIVPIEITNSMLADIKVEIPELAQNKTNRFVREYNIPLADAEIISADKHLADLFEECVKKIEPILTARWIRRELLRVLNFNKKSLTNINLNLKNFVELLELIQAKKITEKTAQRLIEKIVNEQFNIKDYVTQESLLMISEKSEIIGFCHEVIKENSVAIQDFKKGNANVLNFLIGAVIRKSRGKAKPDIVKKLLTELIN